MSVRLEDVHKAFGGLQVLKGISFQVEDGETFTIVGPSGAGKSSLLKHIIGLLQPDRGAVWVDEQRLDTLTRVELNDLRRRVGYVFQFAALFDSMDVRENVGLGLKRMPGMTAAQIEERVQECLTMVDMIGFENRLPSELSGGQRKRIGLARALATRPAYLLYDEPTTGLDPVTTTVIDRLILRMRNELGVTSVVITHDMNSALRVSDRIALLYDGEIRFCGTPDAFMATDDPIVRGFVDGVPELLETGRSMKNPAGGGVEHA